MTDIAKLALAGLLGGAVALGTVSCGDSGSKAPAEKAPADAPAEKPAAGEYSEIHTCAGLNSCKGLGGCKVTADKLTELAEKVGMDPAKAGAAHECKGLNECKGLGGCGVDAEKLAKLKAKLK